MRKFFNKIDEKLLSLADEAEEEIREDFRGIEKTAEYCGAKILSSFINNRVSQACFYGSSGYGYDDVGRGALDKVYAEIFGAEDALVRHNFVSGTHALSVALFGILRPGDKLVSITGEPYDTLTQVIGTAGVSGSGSLRDFGISFEKVDLLPDGNPDTDNIKKAAVSAKAVYIQRSRGYTLRRALTIADIKKMADEVKSVNPGAVIIVDNCYGEFTEYEEPTDAGADICVGSLIKNTGGGIAQTGGYIAGRRGLIELCANRLTCVGMGKEIGCTLGQNKEMFLGLFMSPEIVANALKTSLFAHALFTKLGYECLPAKGEKRSDTITVIKLGSEDRVAAFCRGIQSGSPVDSFLTPEAWDMPGYEHKVIMAAGTFSMGASIELSADAPMREPYAVWLQGGITYPGGKLGVLHAAAAVGEVDV